MLSGGPLAEGRDDDGSGLRAPVRGRKGQYRVPPLSGRHTRQKVELLGAPQAKILDSDAKNANIS